MLVPGVGGFDGGHAVKHRANRPVPPAGRPLQAIEKSTTYLNVFMYVVREFEDALDDCELDAPNNNYNSVHAWDEGV